MNKISIPLPLASLNDAINANRTNKYKGAKLKKANTYKCFVHTKKAMNQGVIFHFPCNLKFTWIIPNKMKDPDNIASAKKYILDGMQDAGFMKNDNLNYVTGFKDVFIVDKNQESVVIIEEG